MVLLEVAVWYVIIFNLKALVDSFILGFRDFEILKWFSGPCYKTDISLQVSVVDELGIPVKFVGVGEGVEDLQPFDAEAFVDAIFS